jgi:hypothetical protein
MPEVVCCGTWGGRGGFFFGMVTVQQ